MKHLIRASEFIDISFVLVLILAHEPLFQREKYDLQDGPKFSPIGRLDKKVNFLTDPN